MKYLWKDKKASLFKLGGCVCLVMILVMVGSFLVGQSLASHSMTVTSGQSGSFQSPRVSKIPHPSGGPLGTMQTSAAPMPMAPSLGLASGSTDVSVANRGQGDASSAGPSAQSKDMGTQYLVKTLKVDLNVKDTRKIADNLLTWITMTDPRATSTGTDYEQVGDNLYNISLTFSVQATRYPQIYRYLRDYTEHTGGRLAAFTESMQNITSTYVDTQSRLKNLRIEQGRLQDLYSHAQAMSDILSIDQQLTNVQGQIESYEAQLNTLSSQVTFYTVSVSLEPLEGVVPVPPTNNGWSIGQICRDAFTASQVFGQEVLGLLIWLLAFSLYIVPFAIIIWLVRKWHISTKRSTMPKAATDIAGLVSE